MIMNEKVELPKKKYFSTCAHDFSKASRGTGQTLKRVKFKILQQELPFLIL
jgi:hypothetical protein